MSLSTPALIDSLMVLTEPKTVLPLRSDTLPKESLFDAVPSVVISIVKGTLLMSKIQEKFVRGIQESSVPAVHSVRILSLSKYVPNPLLST